MKIDRELLLQQFNKRENEVYHPSYDMELAFYEMIRNGEVERIRNSKRNIQADEFEHGTLSKDKIRNLKYHLIVSVTMICRFCIEGGMDERDAYGLSDIYINKIDEAKQEDELRRIHQLLIYDYAERMKHISEKKVKSVYCVKVIDYVDNHLHEHIQVSDIADYVGLEISYLSKLFRREVGCTLVEYIHKKKIQVAQNMLVYSEYSCAEISQYLAYASNSHFTQVFKKHCQMTPMQYRNQYYRSHWNEE